MTPVLLIKGWKSSINSITIKEFETLELANEYRREINKNTNFDTHWEVARITIVDHRVDLLDILNI